MWPHQFLCFCHRWSAALSFYSSFLWFLTSFFFLLLSFSWNIYSSSAVSLLVLLHVHLACCWHNCLQSLRYIFTTRALGGSTFFVVLRNSLRALCDLDQTRHIKIHVRTTTTTRVWIKDIRFLCVSLRLVRLANLLVSPESSELCISSDLGARAQGRRYESARDRHARRLRVACRFRLRLVRDVACVAAHRGGPRVADRPIDCGREAPRWSTL